MAEDELPEGVEDTAEADDMSDDCVIDPVEALAAASEPIAPIEARPIGKERKERKKRLKGSLPPGKPALLSTVAKQRRDEAMARLLVVVSDKKRDILVSALAKGDIPDQEAVKRIAVLDNMLDMLDSHAVVRRNARQQLLKIYGLAADKVEHSTKDYADILKDIFTSSPDDSIGAKRN